MLFLRKGYKECTLAMTGPRRLGGQAEAREQLLQTRNAHRDVDKLAKVLVP